MRICRIGLTGVVLAALVSGCGEDPSAPIEKSPYAPTPDQIKEMEKAAMKSAKGGRPAR